MGSTIIGCGKALPKLEVQNEELQTLVDTSSEWIVSRTGIESRRIAVAETNTDLSVAAARQALGWDESPYSERSVAPEEIDLVIYATITPDVMVPSCAGLLRKRLGLKNALAFDLNAACSGFVYGLSVAESMMAASQQNVAGAAGRNPIRRALIVGSERLSRVTNWSDRNTCVLFGDGAGAAVVEWDENRPGILSSFMVNEDDETNALSCPTAYDSPLPFNQDGVASRSTVDSSLASLDRELEIDHLVAAGEPRQALRMDGQKVFKFAAEAMTTAVNAVLDRAGITLDDVACIVPHQANERIIKYAAKKIGRPMDFFQVSIAHRGNSSAACVPMTLADAFENGRIKPGDKVIMVAFGGGFTSGAVLFEA